MAGLKPSALSRAVTAARSLKVRSGVAETSWPRWLACAVATVAEAGEAVSATAAAGAAIAAAAMVITSPAVTGPLGRRPFIRNGVNVRCSRVVSMVSTLEIPGRGQNPAGHRIGPGAAPRTDRVAGVFDGIGLTRPLWPHQVRALGALDRDVARGDRATYLVVPPGGGKTLIGLEAARRLGRPAVVLCPNTAIQAQWIAQ